MNYLIALLMACATLLVAGCGGSTTPTGKVNIVATLNRADSAVTTQSISEITRVVVTVSAGITNDFPPFPVDLVYDPATFTASGTVDVLAGSGRSFRVDALSGNEQLLYTDQGNVDVPANGLASLNLLLKPPLGDVGVIGVIHDFDGPAGIEITKAPLYGEGGSIEGKVKNINPADVGVAVYIYVSPNWWTKPYWDSPVTPVGSDGTYVCNVTTGGVDSTATEIRAYLIRKEYSPPKAPPSLPPDPVTADVLAMASVTRTPPQ